MYQHDQEFINALLGQLAEKNLQIRSLVTLLYETQQGIPEPVGEELTIDSEVSSTTNE